MTNKEKSFYQIMVDKKITNKGGNPYKSRLALYNRAKIVFHILYGDYTIDDPVLSQSVFWEKYCFTPKKREFSFADYLVNKNIMDQDYNIVDPVGFSEYITIWTHETEICPYEKITITEIRNFETIVRAENELYKINREFFE